MRKQISQAVLTILQAMLPSYSDDSSPAIVTPLTYTGFYSPEQPVYPQIAVFTQMPDFRPHNAGGIMGQAHFTTGQVRQVRRSFLYSDVRVTCRIATRLENEREQIGDQLLDFLWGGLDGQSVPWFHRMAVAGFVLRGHEADNYSRQIAPGDENTLNPPVLYVNDLVLLGSSQFVWIPDTPVGAETATLRVQLVGSLS